MLLQIKEYIQREQIVTLKQLQKQFKIDASAILPMITIWLKKGIIEECNAGCTSTCGKCFKKILYYKFSEKY